MGGEWQKVTTKNWEGGKPISLNMFEGAGGDIVVQTSDCRTEVRVRGT